jgi:uncharacterized protein YxeA
MKNMKTILTACVLILMVIGANAQRKTKFGITTGAGAVLHKKADYEFGPEKGTTFNIGLFVSQPVFKKQFIQTGLLYNFENPKMDAAYLDIDSNLPLNSLEIPILFGWEFLSNFNAKAGVSALWLTNKSIEKDEVGFDWHLGMSCNIKWAELSLTYQQGLNNTNMQYRIENQGFNIVYKRKVVKFTANIPLNKLF